MRIIELPPSKIKLSPWPDWFSVVLVAAGVLSASVLATIIILLVTGGL